MLGFKNGLAVITAFSVVFCASFLLGNDKAMAGGFANEGQCRNFIPLDITASDVKLSAVCSPNNISRTKLTISGFIQNYDGSLGWTEPGKGKFNQNGCSNIRLEEPFNDPNPPFQRKAYLRADCDNWAGGNEEAIIDLNEKISNRNGTLVYDGIDGQEVLGEPDTDTSTFDGTGPGCVSVPGPPQTPLCE